jgi:hypothetical protein
MPVASLQQRPSTASYREMQKADHAGLKKKIPAAK